MRRETVHNIYLDSAKVPAANIRTMSTRFVKECEMMSTLRHPHIVQFLGVAMLQDSRLPALIMERLMTSLHDLLEPQPKPPSDAPKPYFPLNIQCSILSNVACGLHERPRPIVHRDLSAKNVLLTSEMVAKIADMGVARIVPRAGPATMTKAPGTGVYMPPEALENKPCENVTDQDKKSKYDKSIDIFSFGVVAIFTLSQTFPCDLQAPNYRHKGEFLPRTELQRREQYMQIIYRKLHKNHPLVQMITRCLDFPEKRPSIHEVMTRYLDAEVSQVRGEDRVQQMSQMNKFELIQDCMRLEQDIQSKEKKLTRVQQQQTATDKKVNELIQECTRLEQDSWSKEQKLTIKFQHKEESMMKKMDALKQDCARFEQDIELKEKKVMEVQQREEAAIKKMETQFAEAMKEKDKEVAHVQQQMEKLSQQVVEEKESRDRDLAQAQQELEEKEIQLTRSKATVAHMTSRMIKVSGPGVTSATVQQPTHFLVELVDASGKPYPLELNFSAELECVSKTASADQPQPTVDMVSPSQHKVSYTAVNRGRHNIRVSVNGQEIGGSPFSMAAYPDPSMLCMPQTVIPVSKPCGIALNSQGDIIVSELHNGKLSTFHRAEKKFRRSPSSGTTQKSTEFPRGIATDEEDSVYVSGKHQLQKFASSGELVKQIGQKGKKGKKEGEFNEPHG